MCLSDAVVSVLSIDVYLCNVFVTSTLYFMSSLSSSVLLSSPSQYGMTTLIWACVNGHTETAEVLLKHGADTTPKDKVSDMYACYISI